MFNTFFVTEKWLKRVRLSQNSNSNFITRAPQLFWGKMFYASGLLRVNSCGLPDVLRSYYYWKTNRFWIYHKTKDKNIFISELDWDFTQPNTDNLKVCCTVITTIQYSSVMNGNWAAFQRLFESSINSGTFRFRPTRCLTASFFQKHENNLHRKLDFLLWSWLEVLQMQKFQKKKWPPIDLQFRFVPPRTPKHVANYSTTHSKNI